ncbi:HD domain-containing protein [Metabacillus sp. 84]|uniref:HD domain-containing protein n=1 Tax=unclassified Metabacillus TaxID=2675274 RepID=UPI003CEEAAB9
MDKQYILSEARLMVKELLGDEGSGHDWRHIERVRDLALQLACGTETDRFIIEMTALFHDLPDRKLEEARRMSGLEIREWLNSYSVEEKEISHIFHILDKISFNGSGTDVPSTEEGKLVQDADRLDAIGAIGIARTFVYAGSRGNPIFDPGKPDSAIQHFYDKLLKLKNLMNTEAGRKEAEARHAFMELYLETFFRELKTGALRSASPDRLC